MYLFSVHDVDYLFGLILFASAGFFVICVSILLSGACIGQDYQHRNTQSHLEFISTQIGACLEKHAWVSWGLLASTQIQILLLFHVFLHCMHNIYKNTKIHVSPAYIAWAAATLSNYFVISLASVVEFKSHSADTKEKIYHYFAAVCTILVFWLLHLLICFYLHQYAHDETDQYSSVNRVYVTLTTLFFCLWVGQLTFSLLSEFAKVIEWLILLNATILHVCAFHVMRQNNVRKNIPCQIDERRWWPPIYVLLSFVGTCGIFLYSAPPWFVHSENANLSTGPEFWLSVIFNHIALALRLSYPYCECF